MASNIDKYQKITYYNLPENYHYFEDVDVTKFDSLTGDEIDSNFFVLEGRDIDSIEISEDKTKIIVTLINGETIESENVFADYIESLSFSYDREDGVLTVCINDCDEEPLTVEGFLTMKDVARLVNTMCTHTDYTLNGDGSASAPLSIARSQRTGCVKPINGVVENLPTTDLAIGDRYITFNTVDNEGRYYNFDGLIEVINALEAEDNGWKVANKHDWDEILNRLETDLFKDHNSFHPSKWLGRRANTMIRQSTLFGLEYCGYVFNGDEKFVSFKNEKASFWAASNAMGKDLCQGDTEAWAKQFQYTKGQVYQTIIDNAIYSSIRLVKDCEDGEKIDTAEILGELYPVTVMGVDNGKAKMWTTLNLNYQTENPNNSFKDESELVVKPFINEWDGDKWVKMQLDDYTVFMMKSTEQLYYIKNNEFFVVNADKSPVNKLIDAANYVYDDYTYNGDFAIGYDNTIDYTINASVFGDGKPMMNDFARLLGALYRTNAVEPIQFNYNYYDWDDNGTLKGSNYKRIGAPLDNSNTLVHDFVAYFAEHQSDENYKIKFDKTIITVTINIVTE